LCGREVRAYAALALRYGILLNLFYRLAPALRQSQELFQKILGTLEDLGTGISVSPSAPPGLLCGLPADNGRGIPGAR